MTNSTHLPNHKNQLDFQGLLMAARQLMAVIMAVVAFSTEAAAQSFPSNCSSKDLDAIETILEGSTPNSLLPGNRRIKLTIANKSASDRRAFVMWAKMNRYDINGVLKESRNIAFGVDSVKKNTTMTLTSRDSLYFGGEDLIELTNIYTAWSGKNTDDITYLLNNSSKIAPNCAVKNPVKVYTGVNARFFTEKAACANGKGLIKTRPFGGKAPYTVSLSLSGSATQTTTTVTNDLDSVLASMPPGIYKVTIVDAKFNSSVFTREIQAPDGLAKPGLNITHPNCTIGKGQIKVTNLNGNAKYDLVQNGQVILSTTNGEFNDIVSGDYKVVATHGFCVNGDSAKVNKQPRTPNKPQFDVFHPTCTRAKGSIKLTNMDAEFAYTLKQNGVIKFTAQGDLFDEVDPGTYDVVAAGVCSNSNGTTINPAPAQPHDIQATVTQSTTENCFRGGKIDITSWRDDKPNNYSYILVNATDTIYAVEGVLDNVKAGTYDLYAIRGQCFKTQGVVINAPADRLPDLEEGDVEFIQPNLCADGSITIKNAKYNNSGFVGNGGQVEYAIFDGAWQSGNSFSVASNAKGKLNIQVQEAGKSSANRAICPGEYKGVVPCTAATVAPEVVTASSRTVVSEQTAKSATTYLGSANMNAAIDVKTIPNPFSSKVRFVISAEQDGNGTLEIFNLQGQKLRTIYSGFINRGTNFFDLTMPTNSNSAELVYVLKVGSTKLSGKLIQAGK
jgi:hypothetical protein